MPFDPATLKYDAAGLIPCVAQDHASGDVLMVAWMNAASVAATHSTTSKRLAGTSTARDGSSMR